MSWGFQKYIFDIYGIAMFKESFGYVIKSLHICDFVFWNLK